MKIGGEIKIINQTSHILGLGKDISKSKANICLKENSRVVREKLRGFSIMPPRYEQVPIWKTRGKYRKEMKHGYNKILYNQRNKDETIVSVIKRLFGEHIT